MNRIVKDYLYLLGIGGAVIALDQWTKWLVRVNLPFQGTWLPEWLSWLSPYARIVHWYNSGAAFGMFQNYTKILTIISIVAIVLIIILKVILKLTFAFYNVSLGFILGGAVGNLIDRYFVGEVTDFINLTFLPVFNIADSSIVIGFCLIIILIIREYFKKEKPKRI